MGANYDYVDSDVCKHCQYRYSWDCGDGLPYPANGCDNFKPDVDTYDKKLVELLLMLCQLEERDD